jgi:hypothetical protein
MVENQEYDRNVTSDWWLAVPRRVEPKVLEWQEKCPDKLDVRYTTQYTGHRIYALTVTHKEVPEGRKRKLLTTVSHGHEPAGTAAIMDFISQLLTGQHLGGEETDLEANTILNETLLTFIPMGNPDGRSRAPVDCWDGSIFDSAEFFDYMKGLRVDGRRFDWPDPRVWKRSEEDLARIGITYEQIDEDAYAEPFWAPERTKYYQLMEQLGQAHRYDALLDLHQTYEQEDLYDTFVLYAAEDWMPREFQQYALAWGADAQAALEKAGAHFSGIHQGGDRRWVINQFTLKYGTPNLLFEVQNNHPNTPMDEQLLYAETVIRASVARLAHTSGVAPVTSGSVHN